MNKTGKNVLMQIVYQVLAVIVPFITGPLISRALGPKLIGEYSFVYSIVTYFSIFCSLGIATLGQREIAACLDDKNERSDVFWNIYYIKLFLSCIWTLCYFLVPLLFELPNLTLYYIMYIYLLGTILDISWLFFGVGDFKVTVIRNSFIKILTLVLIVLFIKDKKDLCIYAFIIAASTLVSNVVLWANIRKYIFYRRPRYIRIKQYIKPMIVLFLPVIASSMYVYMDKIILGIICNNIELGYYSSMEKVINIPNTIIAAIGIVLYSRSVYLIQSGNRKVSSILFSKSISAVIWFSIGCCMGISAISNEFTFVYFGEGYKPVVLLLQLGTVYLFFRCVRSVVKTQLMLPYKKDSFFNSAILTGAIVNLVLNFCLIPISGAIGAVVATIISDFSSTAVCLFCMRKHVDFGNILSSVLVSMFVGACMVGAISIISRNIDISLLPKLLLEITTGIVCYLIITVLAERFVNIDLLRAGVEILTEKTNV